MSRQNLETLEVCVSSEPGVKFEICQYYTAHVKATTFALEELLQESLSGPSALWRYVGKFVKSHFWLKRSMMP